MPWPSWSWGPWSVSPGALPWTSSRTLGVGVAHLPSQRLSGGCDTWSPWLPPFKQKLWPGHSAHAIVGHSPGGGVGPELLVRVEGGPEHETPGGLGGGSGCRQ